ncbi:MAG: cytochrome c [Geminicoccaceae bacterium]|nr:cytochrome c [Geminicoccaceae bacterium]
MMIATSVVAVLGAGLFYWNRSQGVDGRHGSAAIEPVIPELTSPARAGEVVFDERCASCHGQDAVGTDQGPPLIHKYYEPGHHGDQAFVMAATRGVRAHHWNFGDMPPVAGITADEIASVIAYVREVQAANGIQ